MKGLLYIGYLILGVFQFFAIIAGFGHWLGIGTFFAAILSFFITYIPVIGTAVGMFGAVSAWGWSWMQAGALFFGPFVALLFLAGISGVIQGSENRA